MFSKLQTPAKVSLPFSIYSKQTNKAIFLKIIDENSIIISINSLFGFFEFDKDFLSQLTH
jgi:hypothetical protein